MGVLQVLLRVANWSLEAGTLHLYALNLLTLREVHDLLLDLVKFVLVHAETLHDHGCRRLGVLPEDPGNDSEIDTSILEHIKNSVEDLLVKQLTSQLKCEALHSRTRLVV